MTTITKEWFFFDPFNESSISIFHNITNKTGIIFFNKNFLKNEQELSKIQKYVLICKKKKIPFLIYASFYWAIKYRAFGLYLPINLKKISLNTRISIFKYKNQLTLSTSVHNLKEIKLSMFLNFSFIFISPVFKTKSHKNMRPLNRIKFINLSKYPTSLIFALGGITKKNYPLIKNKFLKGFGGITHFNEMKNHDKN